MSVCLRIFFGFNPTIHIWLVIVCNSPPTSQNCKRRNQTDASSEAGWNILCFYVAVKTRLFVCSWPAVRHAYCRQLFLLIQMLILILTNNWGLKISCSQLRNRNDVLHFIVNSCLMMDRDDCFLTFCGLRLIDQSQTQSAAYLTMEVIMAASGRSQRRRVCGVMLWEWSPGINACFPILRPLSHS